MQQEIKGQSQVGWKPHSWGLRVKQQVGDMTKFGNRQFGFGACLWKNQFSKRLEERFEGCRG